VVTAGIKAPHVEIPMIGCHDQKIGFDVFAKPSQNTPLGQFDFTEPSFIDVDTRYLVTRELLMQTD